MEDKRGRPGRYKPDDPLPADIEILPAPEKLEESMNRCSVAALREGVKSPPPPSSAEEGGERYRGEGDSTPHGEPAALQHSDHEPGRERFVI